MLDDFLKLSGSFAAFSGSVYGYSEEQKKFLSSGLKCFSCNNSLTNKTFVNKVGVGQPNYYLKDGTKIKSSSLKLLLDRNIVVECPSCGYRWNWYGESNPVIPNKLEFVYIKETHRSEEILGTEKRLIDNSKSRSKTTRKFTIGREWSKSYSIQYENTQVKGTELNLGIKLPEIDLGSIKVTSEETLRKEYSISEEKKENYTEEVEFEVSEFNKLNIIFSWKRIWQYGIIKFRNQDNTEFDIPFKVAVGVTFDQSQIDE